MIREVQPGGAAVKLEEFSLPSRVAGHDEGIGPDELQR
jgi:hypothetical protein